MKTVLMLFASLFLLTNSMLAQPPAPAQEEGARNEKMEALKIAFITKRLNLSPEESQKFWPTYNQYEEEKKQVRKASVGSVKELKEDGEFTNAEAETAIAKYIEFKAKDLDLTKKYVAEFRKILPATKVAKLVTAEDHFKKMLMKQAQQGGGQRPGGPQGQKPQRGQGQ